VEKQIIEPDILKYFFEDTFIPPRLANDLMDEYSFIYANGELFIYQDGVYMPIGVDVVKKQCRERLGNASRINRVNEVLEHVKIMSLIDSKEINTHKRKLNLVNGMYDIDTQELSKHAKSYLSTIRIPVIFDAKADCSVITDWLQSTLKDAQCIELACELFGYMLIPDTTMCKAFMLTGPGSNGKSTFLTVLENFIGNSNVSKIPLQELSENRFKRADVFGKLVNLFADLDNRELESTTYFKTIVSGDSIDAERKLQNPFSFKPFARLVFSANEIPRSQDKSHAYYRRWAIIPFENRFEGKDERKGLADELSKPKNLSALLNCALSGLRHVLERQAFIEPDRVKQALFEYEKANDPVKGFISDACIFDANERTERGALYISFTRYCDEAGFKAITRNAFYQRIRVFREIQDIQEHNGERVFSGIKLKAG